MTGLGGEANLVSSCLGFTGLSIKVARLRGMFQLLDCKLVRRRIVYYLQYEYEVGTVNDYNDPAPTFNFNPGFKADFSTSSPDANDITVKVHFLAANLFNSDGLCDVHVLPIAWMMSTLLKPPCTPAPHLLKLKTDVAAAASNSACLACCF